MLTHFISLYSVFQDLSNNITHNSTSIACPKFMALHLISKLFIQRLIKVFFRTYLLKVMTNFIAIYSVFQDLSNNITHNSTSIAGRKLKALHQMTKLFIQRLIKVFFRTCLLKVMTNFKSIYSVFQDLSNNITHNSTSIAGRKLKALHQMTKLFIQRLTKVFS